MCFCIWLVVCDKTDQAKADVKDGASIFKVKKVPAGLRL